MSSTGKLRQPEQDQRYEAEPLTDDRLDPGFIETLRRVGFTEEEINAVRRPRTGTKARKAVAKVRR